MNQQYQQDYLAHNPSTSVSTYHSHSISSVVCGIGPKFERPHSLLIDDLHNEIRLIYQKSQLQLLNAMLYKIHSLLFIHTLFPISIHNGQTEFGCIPLNAEVGLYTAAEVIHNVE